MPVPVLSPVVVTGLRLTAFDVLLQQRQVSEFQRLIRNKSFKPTPKIDRPYKVQARPKPVSREIREPVRKSKAKARPKPKGFKVRTFARKKLSRMAAAKLAGKITARFVPGLGLGLLAYDALDLLAESATNNSPRSNNETLVSPTLLADVSVSQRPLSRATAVAALLDPVVVSASSPVYDLASQLSLAQDTRLTQSALSRFADNPVAQSGLTSPATSVRSSPKTKTSPLRARIEPPLNVGFVVPKERECVPARKKSRPTCPARGYKLKAVKWRKVSCL
jgi:hypothetical protein